MSELYWKPAHELAAMIRRRDIKAAELMDLTIKRIEQTNPKLNAFCALRADDAIADARAIDEKIARREELGPLAGLPLGVKDLEDAFGLPTTHGSQAFKDHMPSADSVQVSRLKAAGAIVIGKTNAPEFGYTAFTKNLLFGVTRNPWNLERIPKKLRIAFHPDFGQLVQRDVMREIVNAVAVFKDLGHDVTTIDDPVPETGRAWMQLGATQSYAQLHEMFDRRREDFGRAFLTGTEGATRVTWKHYMKLRVALG